MDYSCKIGHPLFNGVYVDVGGVCVCSGTNVCLSSL